MKHVVGKKQSSRIPQGLGRKAASRVAIAMGSKDSYLTPDQITSPPSNAATSHPNPIWSNSANTNLSQYIPKGISRRIRSSSSV